LDHAPSVSSPARTSVGYALMIAATVGHALRVDERDLAVPDGEPLGRDRRGHHAKAARTVSGSRYSKSSRIFPSAT
jgi:hypothetical protein